MATRKKTKAELEQELSRATEQLASARARITELETQVKLLTGIVTDAAKEYVPMPYPYAPNPLQPWTGGDQRSWRCSDGTGNHDYPNVWWGITMPPCRKCGYAPPGINWQQTGVQWTYPTYQPIPTPWVDPIYYRTTYGPNSVEITTIGTMTQPNTTGCAPHSTAVPFIGATWHNVSAADAAHAPVSSGMTIDLTPRASSTAAPWPGGAGTTTVSAVQALGLASTSSPGVH